MQRLPDGIHVYPSSGSTSCIHLMSIDIVEDEDRHVCKEEKCSLILVRDIIDTAFF